MKTRIISTLFAVASLAIAETPSAVTTFVNVVDVARLKSLGAPVPPTMFDQAQVWISDPDQSTRAYRVTLRYTDSVGKHSDTILAVRSPYGALATFPVQAAEFKALSVNVESLKTAAISEVEIP